MSSAGGVDEGHNFPDQRKDFLFEWEALGFRDLQNSQRTWTITIIHLLFNSRWVLAERLVVESNARILSDTPLYFPPSSFLHDPRIPPKDRHFGSAIEALAIQCISFSYEPLRRAIDLMKYDMDTTRVVLLCIGLHFYPMQHGCCKTREDTDKCYMTQSLRDYDSRHELTTYRLTPLQLAVHCLDYFATKILLERGVDPNGLGLLNGESVPIHLYEVDDIWGTVSPLHILRHAGYAPEAIDGSLDMMEGREAFRDKIEALLISYGATDFVQLPSLET